MAHVVQYAMSDLPTLTGAESKTLEPNSEYQGTITGLEVRETDRSDWNDYLDIEVTPDGPDATLNPSYSIPDTGAVTHGHDLGKLIERMTGEPIDVGADYDLGEVIGQGTRVAVNTGPEDDEGYVNARKDSLRPVDQDYDGDSEQESEEGDTGEAGVSEELASAMSEVSSPPAERSTVITGLAQNGYSDLVGEFNEACDGGTISVDANGMITEFPEA